MARNCCETSWLSFVKYFNLHILKETKYKVFEHAKTGKWNHHALLSQAQLHVLQYYNDHLCLVFLPIQVVNSLCADAVMHIIFLVGVFQKSCPVIGKTESKTQTLYFKDI